jgi:hypothetical protein
MTTRRRIRAWRAGDLDERRVSVERQSRARPQDFAHDMTELEFAEARGRKNGRQVNVDKHHSSQPPAGGATRS